MTTMATALTQDEAFVGQAVDEPARDKTEHEKVEYLDKLWREGDSALNIQIDGRSLWDIKVEGGRRYLGDHHDYQPVRRGVVQSTINRTGAAITTTAAVQTEQPIRGRIAPQQTNDEPIYFVTAKGVRKLQTLMAEGTINFEGFAIEELSPETPLDPAHGEALMKLTEPQPSPMMDGTFSPPLLEEDDDIIPLTDALCAEQMQMIFDAKMKASFADVTVVELETLSNIYGDQAVVYEWDFDYDEPKLFCPNWTNVRFDPRGSWVKNSRFVLYQEDIDADWAEEHYPKLKKAIQQARGDGLDSGRHQAHLSDGSKEGGKENWVSATERTPQEQNFDVQIDVITIRTAWIRNYDYPMSVEDALGKGLIEPLIEDGQPAVDDEGRPLFMGAEGKMVYEGSANWPQRKGIRQLTVMPDVDKVVQDVECPYSDIPMPWVKNSMIQYSPHGKGEPFNLESISQIINRITTVIENTIRYNQYPEEFWREDFLDRLKEVATDYRAHPGRIIGVPPDLWDDILAKGQPFTFRPDVPQINESWIRVLMLMIELHQQMAGDVEAAQGQLPSSDTSGVALEQLQNASRRLMAFKAKHLEWTYEWLSKLVINSITNWMSDEEFDRYLGRFGPVMRTALRARLKNLKYDLIVEAVAGKGANRRLEADKGNAMASLGMVSQQTYLEMMDHPDAKGEIKRQRRESLEKAGMIAPPEPPVAGTPPSMQRGKGNRSSE